MDANKNVLVKYIRDDGGKPLEMIKAGQTYYYLYNAHGDVTSITDSNGSTVASYSYDEWGNQSVDTRNSTFDNPYRYAAGYNSYYDKETGFYKMGARYYNPDVGRWLTRDPSKDLSKFQPVTLNRYVYVENNPISKYDSTGLSASTNRQDIKIASSLGLYDLPNYFIRMNYYRQNNNITFQNNKVTKLSASDTPTCFTPSGWYYVDLATSAWTEHQSKQAWALSNITFFNQTVPPGVYANYFRMSSTVTNTGKFVSHVSKNYVLTTPLWTSLWHVRVTVNAKIVVNKWKKRVKYKDGNAFFADDATTADIF